MTQSIFLLLMSGIALFSKVIPITETNYPKEVEAKGLFILEVYSNSCPPCKAVAPIFSQVSEEFAGKARFGKVEIHEQPELSDRLGVYATPTFIFFKNGEEVGRHVGGMTKEEMTQKIKQI